MADRRRFFDVCLATLHSRRLWLAVCILVWTAPAVVSAQRLNITRYDAAAGLPSSRVLSVAQDDTGYLWFGTDAGLSRFDGTVFRSVPLAASSRGTRVIAIETAGDEILYATAEGDVGVVTRAGPQPLIGDGLGVGIRSIAVDRAGGFLLAGPGGVVELRDGSSRRVTAPDRVPAGCCNAALRDSRGRLWAGGTAGLFVIRGGSYARADGIAPGTAVNDLVEASDASVWIATSDGLYRHHAGETARVETGRERVFLSAYAHNDELWFGTRRGALRIAGGRTEPMAGAAGLGAGIVNDIIGDREGNVWMAMEGGVAKWSPSRFVAFTPTSGLPDAFVVDVAASPRGALVAVRSAIVSIGEDRQVQTEISVDPEGDLTITAVAALGEAGLAVGTDRGLVVRSGAGEEFLRVASAPVTALFAAGDTVLVGTESGLRRLDGDTLESLGPSGPASGHVIDVVQDRDGRIWVALASGDVWLGEEAGFRRLAVERDGATIPIVDLAVAGDGVWAATRGAGAWKFSPDGSASSLTRARNGLASDFVDVVLEGLEGEVWLCTSRGVDRWQGDSGIVHFDLADGLAALTCNSGAGAVGPAGTIWLGTALGLSLEVAERPATTQRPVAVISGVYAGGTAADRDVLRSLSADRNDLTIAFSALTYLDEGGTRFQYRLQDTSSRRVAGWSELTKQRRVSFMDLAPGEYLFEVQAISGAGLWSEETAPLEIVIRPRLWNRLPVQVAAATIVILIAGLLFWRRLRRLDGERQQLRVMVDKRTRELVEKNALLERMATTDELTGLANRRFFLDTMERELRKLTRISTDQQLSLLVIDLDRFKSVNDRYGHAAGDAVLRQVAQRLAQSVRATDVPARYGGEEFAILLPDTDSRGAEFLAEKLRDDVETAPVRHDGRTITVTISVGVATIDPPTRYDPAIEDDLVRRADEAMYEAKSGGRNRVVVAPPAQASE
jgi:diguanylate cyclase (GGDEF)-like protein